jgi:class 3 adenylate cyclase
MTSKDFKRKLAAIFSADIVGYGRLTSADDVSTVTTISSYPEIMASLIRQHNDRVVNSPDDNVLA